MRQNHVGLFIQGQGLGGQQYDDTLAHVVKANYATVGVMNNFGLCRDIKNELPDCVVVHRDSTFEPKPADDYIGALNRKLDTLTDDRIVLMVNCEQGFDAPRVKMWSDMLPTANAAGHHLCVGNTSCGSIKCGQGSDPNEWLTIGKPLLEALLKHPGNYLGVHNYTGPFLWLVSNGGWGDPHNPPKSIDWTKPQWHLGREAQGIMAACNAPGNEALKPLLKTKFMMNTEGHFDQMADTEQNLDNPYHAVKSNRWRYLIPKWKEWYPDKDAEDVLADQMIWAWETIYEPLGFYVGTHFFTYRDAGGEWQDDRIDNAPVYLKRMEDYAQQAAPTPPPPVEPPAPIPPPVVEPPMPDNKKGELLTQIHAQVDIVQAAMSAINMLLDKLADEL